MPTDQLPTWMWPTALMSVCSLAVWRGRDHERLAAGAYLAGWALTLLVFRARGEDVRWAVLGVDAILFCFFLWLALRSARYWPLFAAGFQLLAVATHLARVLDSGVGGWPYLTAGLAWSYFAILAIGYGAWTAPRVGEPTRP